MDGKKADIFIKIEEYREVIDVLELLQHKMKQARMLLRKINDTKLQEDAELEEWNAAINDIESKISLIDRSLLEPESL